MALVSPVLDLIIIPTHSSFSLGVGDFSKYPTGFTPVSPTLEITPPGFPTVAVPFTPNNLNIYNSSTLQLTCDPNPQAPIPDGIYTLKYSIAPAYDNFVTKTFMRIDLIQERFDNVFMALDIMECDSRLKSEQKQRIDRIEFLIAGSIAAANKCAERISAEMYNEADREIKRLEKYCGM